MSNLTKISNGVKKLLAISGIALGVLLLSGCGSQPAPVTPLVGPQSSQEPSTPATATVNAPDTTAQSNSTNSADVPTTTAPAKTSDVDSTLNQVNSDLNSIDKNTPDTNDLNSTDLQK